MIILDIWKKVVSKQEYSNDTKFLINLFKKEALRQGYDKNRFHNGMKTHAKESLLLTGKIGSGEFAASAGVRYSRALALTYLSRSYGDH